MRVNLTPTDPTKPTSHAFTLDNPFVSCPLCGDDADVHEWVTLEGGRVVACDREEA